MSVVGVGAGAVRAPLRRVLDSAAGGRDHGRYALFPGSSRTTLIADERLLADEAQASMLAALIGRVASDEQARLGGIQDLWAVVDGIMHAQEGLAMAPAWLVRIGRPASPGLSQ